MASLHDLHRALFPTARPLGAAELAGERAEREVGWVRVLKFTKDVVETWLEFKRAGAKEVQLRPHPYEFYLYSEL